MPAGLVAALPAIIGGVTGIAGAAGSVLSQKSAAKQREKEAKMFVMDKVKNSAFGDDMVLDKSVSQAPNVSLVPGGPQIKWPQPRKPF